MRPHECMRAVNSGRLTVQKKAHHGLADCVLHCRDHPAGGRLSERVNYVRNNLCSMRRPRHSVSSTIQTYDEQYQGTRRALEEWVKSYAKYSLQLPICVMSDRPLICSLVTLTDVARSLERSFVSISGSLFVADRNMQSGRSTSKKPLKLLSKA